MPQQKAIIEYGKVINIFVHEGGTLDLPEGQMYINVGDQGVNIGWTYDYVTGLFSDGNGLTMANRVRRVESAVSDSQLASDIAFVVLAQNEMLDDITITEHASKFPVWDKNYRTQNRLTIVQDEGKLYRNIHPILDESQNLKPSTDKNSTMWQLIGDPGEEYPMWVQPLGAHDAYELGAKVSHNGEHWVSVHPGANTWAPGVYGWGEV